MSAGGCAPASLGRQPGVRVLTGEHDDHVPTVTLRNDVETPILGIGVYQVPPEDTERIVSDALAAPPCGRACA